MADWGTPVSRQLPLIDTPLTVEDLDRFLALAEAADEQRRVGGIDWPGRPSRQRLELFLAMGPLTVIKLVQLARTALERHDI